MFCIEIPGKDFMSVLFVKVVFVGVLNAVNIIICVFI